MPWQGACAQVWARARIGVGRPLVARRGALAIVRAASSPTQTGVRRCPLPQYDVLGIGNAIVDVIARTEDDFLVTARHEQGRDGADRRAARRGDLCLDGAGDANLRRIGRQHDRGRRELRRARGLRRQGEGRHARQGVQPRHPRDRRRLHDAAGGRRSLDRALLRAGDAGRRAHHEHLSGRRAEPHARRPRRDADRGRAASSIWRAICGIRRTPRKRSARRRRSRMAPAARSR